MVEERSNIVLIGMPGSGKSTVGESIAKKMSLPFIDTDLLIQVSEGCSLQDIVDREGYMALRRIEERIILNLDCHHSVIATGGSAVYSPIAMKRLKAKGIIVFLHLEMASLISRIHNFETRGLAKDPKQSFADLYKERMVLYNEYADITVDCRDLSMEDISVVIMQRLNG